MRLLLDSHIAIWFATFPVRISAGERERMATASEVVISVVAIWEARLKWQSLHASGERKGAIDPAALLTFAENLGWPLLAVSAQHAATELETPIAHRDPFDELLLVQAQVEGLRLLTRDRALRDHPLALFA